MSDINLKRFVDIDLRYHNVSIVSSIRDTAVLLQNENSSVASEVYASYADFLVDFPEPSGTDADAYPVTRAYAKVFFNERGNKLLIKYQASMLEADLKTAIAGLANNYIVVAIAMSTEASAVATKYALVKGIAVARAADSTIYGINQKILLVRNTVATDTDKVDNLAVKVSSQLGAEMTIAAYLTNIDFNGFDTVLDYMYTKENLQPESTDELLEAVLDNNCNVVMKLAQNTVNLGGNLKNGRALTNHFALIVLEQVLTDVILNVLLSKVKGVSGLTTIQSAVADEMTRWLSNGYLSTDKVWTDDTLKVSIQGVEYTIIEKDTPLNLGYSFVVLPLSALTAADIEARKAPPMYLIVADSYGIRTVTIKGEVI